MKRTGCNVPYPNICRLACFILFKLDWPIRCSGTAFAHREDGQNIWPKHVAVNIVQLVGSEICVHVGGVEV
jgi:hypothetical protein